MFTNDIFLLTIAFDGCRMNEKRSCGQRGGRKKMINRIKDEGLHNKDNTSSLNTADLRA